MELGLDFALWDFWFWGTLALVLIVLEILISGEFFLWFAVAAVLTGVVSLVTDDWRYQIAAFASFAVICAAVAIHRWRRRKQVDSARPFLNRRTAALVGRTAEVRRSIPAGGHGEVMIDGSLWLATAPKDIPAGTRVRVSGGEGTLLRVEPVEEKKGSVPFS